MDITLPQLLKSLVEQGASDLHLSSGTPPRLRINGSLMPLNLPVLEPTFTKQLCYSVLTEQQKRVFEQKKEIDFAFSLKGLARFRANIFLQKNSVAGVFRLIPFQLKTLEELKLPPIIKKLCELPRGLVLVTGPTGSGKSTTLASMINYINESSFNHIVTIEDPVEFLHVSKKCVVNQREVGGDTHNFAAALRSALRQDPDVVLVGEMRDLETIQLAISTAETGHLVFGTLHTNSAVSSLNRMIDVFPPHQQDQVRAQLSLSLQAVVSQILIPSQMLGRVMAMEVMVPNTAIRNLIRENKLHQVYSMMQTGQDNTGMQTLNQALVALILRRQIETKVAFTKSQYPEELEDLLIAAGAGQRPGAGQRRKA